MKTGSYGQQLDFYCKNPDGTVMRDLDEVDGIKLRMKLNKDGQIIVKDCTLVDEVTGHVRYIMEQGILTEEGELYYEIRTIVTGTEDIPCETGIIRVSPSLEEII